MSELNVRIVKLEPMRVASFHGFGEHPEELAWAKLEAWATPRGYLGDWTNHRVFGFDNPHPSPSSPNYGYEFWMMVGPEVGASDGVTIVEFAGGLYAVCRVGPIGDPGQSIPAAWKKLAMWREDSKYRPARHQWLEEHIDTGGTPPNNWTLDLYLPIAA